MPVLILVFFAALLIGAVILGLWWGQTHSGKPATGDASRKGTKKPR